jgi:hypothetical protein
MTTKLEVYDDLKDKVEELLEATRKDAMEKLDKLQRSGVGLLDDHERNGMTYETPKDFMVAYSGEILEAYIQRELTAKYNRLIDNYRRMM